MDDIPTPPPTPPESDEESPTGQRQGEGIDLDHLTANSFELNVDFDDDIPTPPEFNEEELGNEIADCFTLFDANDNSKLSSGVFETILSPNKVFNSVTVESVRHSTHGGSSTEDYSKEIQREVNYPQEGFELGRCGNLPVVCGFANIHVFGYSISYSISLQFENVGQSAVDSCVFRYSIPRSTVLCDVNILFTRGELEYKYEVQPQQSSQAEQSCSVELFFPIGGLAVGDGVIVRLTLVGLLETDSDNTNLLTLRLRSDMFPPAVIQARSDETLHCLRIFLSTPFPLKMIHSSSHKVDISERPEGFQNVVNAKYSSVIMVTNDSKGRPFLPMIEDFTLIMETSMDSKFSDIVVEYDKYSQSTASYCVSVPICPPLDSSNYASVLYEPNVDAIFVFQLNERVPHNAQIAMRYMLQLCIQSLPSHCKFNCVFFGENSNITFPQPMDYLNSHVKNAFAWCGGADTARAGGNITAALEGAVGKTISDKKICNVFMVLTDEVFGADDAAAFIVEKRSHFQSRFQCSCFYLSLPEMDQSKGPRTMAQNQLSAHASAIWEISRTFAHCGGGVAQICNDVEQLRLAILAQMRMRLCPSITELKVYVDGSSKSCVAKEIPPVLYSHRHTVFLRLNQQQIESAFRPVPDKTVNPKKGKLEIPTVGLSVVYRDHLGKQRIHTISLKDAFMVEARVLHILSAQQRMAELHKANGLGFCDLPIRVDLCKDKRQMNQQEGIALSNVFTIPCYYTNSVSRCTDAQKASELRGRVCYPILTGNLSVAPPALSMALSYMGARKQSKTEVQTPFRSKVAMAASGFIKAVEGFDKLKPDARRALLMTRPEYSLTYTECFIHMQQPEGFWKFDMDVLQLLQMDKNTIVQNMRCRPADIECWVTALVVVTLRRVYQTSQPLWLNVYLKGLRYLHKKNHGGLVKYAHEMIGSRSTP